MIRHKWNKDNECVNCGILRERTTIKTLMAISGGRDYYKYEVKYKYIFDGIETTERPNCWRTTYDN